MVTAATSATPEVAEDLLGYFVDIGNKECFAAMLYVCFDLLSQDVVEELSWQHGLNDFYMPYKIQNSRTLVDKVCRYLCVAEATSLICLADTPFGEGGKRILQERVSEGEGGV